MTTKTSTFLLAGLRDQANDRVWTEFCDRYGPILVGFGKRLGLSEPDAQDAAQESLAAFAEAYRQQQYDRSKGRLRSWLFGIAKNKIRYLQRQRARDPVEANRPDKTRLMQQVADDHSISEAWEAEWRYQVVRSCLEEVRRQLEPKTVQAFELHVLNKWPTEKVAAHLGMSANAVLKAKRRVLARMREINHQRDEDW